MTSEELTAEQIDKCYIQFRNKVARSVPSEDVEDIVQEGWVRLLENIQKFRGESLFETWACRIMLRVVADYYRDGRPLYRRYHFIDPDPDRMPKYHEADQGARITFLDLVSKASERETKPRGVLLEHYLNGYGDTELAKKLGISYDAVRNQHRYGLKNLRDILVEEQR